jgi:hypothetical protein
MFGLCASRMPYSVMSLPMGSKRHFGKGGNPKTATITFHGDLDSALDELNACPELYEGIRCCDNGDKVFLYRKGCNVVPNLSSPEDGFTWYYTTFDTGLGDGSDAFEDEYCEDLLAEYQGQRMTESLKRIGRGEGLYDVPDLKICGYVDPMDVSQGAIGNCWLMAAMSAVAEFDGEFEWRESAESEGSDVGE